MMAWHMINIWIITLFIAKDCEAYPVDWSNAGGGSEEVWGPALASMALLGACAVLALLGCVCCRQTKTPAFQEFTDTASNHSLSTAGFVNPLAGVTTPASVSTEFTIFPPPGVCTNVPNNPAEPPPVRFEPLPDIRPRPAVVTAVEVDIEPAPTVTPLRPAAFSSAAPAPCELLDEPSFPRERLKYLRELGKGWFGKVVEGEALEGSSNSAEVARVAVRILRDDAPALDQALFLREVASLRALSHPNLLRVLGCCCEAQPLLIIMDLCPTGDFKSFLLEQRSHAATLAQEGEITRLMCELAAGLEHMARAGFIHTDLAARNCQLTSDLTLKIGDYGTSIEKFRDEYYCAGDVAVPIRWCAPESLVCTDLTIETKQVTSAANVWTLGVVLWEVLQFGQLPHADLSDDEVILTVLGPPHHILPAPSLSLPHSQYLYHLMKLCWTAASERPTAGQILAMLRHLHSSRDQAGDSSERFEQRWALLRPNKAGTLFLPVLEQNPCLDLQDFTPSPSLPDKDMLSYKSPSLQNLRGSLEDLHEARMASSLPNSTENISASDWKLEQDSIKIEDVRIEIDDVCAPCHIEIDRELFSYQVSSSLEDEDARKICEAIQDLDDALALEKTSSSSEDSSRESTPRQKHPGKVGSSSSVLDFRLQQVCASDSEEEATWRGQVERGEFTEKVRQKSRSVQDLMVLTHIDPSSAEQSSDDADAPIPLVSAEPFKSEGNICGAVVIEGLLDSFRQLQKLSKIDDFIQDSSSDQHALVSPQPVISDSLKNKLDFISNIPVTQPEISNSDTFVSKESQIDEFLSSNTFKYLISEESIPPEININSSDVPIIGSVETDLSNTHDITVDATDLLAEESLNSADLLVNQSRQEIRKTLLLNLNSLDNTQRDSSSCSVTTSTDDSDLTILMNPNLDTPVDTETTKDTEILDMPDDGKKTDGYNAADIVEGINAYFNPIETSVKSDATDSEQMQTVLQNDSFVTSQVFQGKDDNFNPAEFVDTRDVIGSPALFTIPATETPLLEVPTGNHAVAPVDPRDIEISCLQSNSTNISLLESGPESIIQLLSDDDRKTSQEDSYIIDKSNICAEKQLKIEVELETCHVQRRDSEVSAESEGHYKSIDKFYEPQSVCDKEEAVYTIAELNSEECIETSAKLTVEDEECATEVNDRLEVSNLCASELSVISDVLESVLSAIVNMEDLATNKDFCKADFVENNNAKVEKCCNVAENIPNLNSNHLIPTTDTSKSKVNLTLGVSDPSSMIAFEPLFPKHHSDYRLRKLKEMNKEYEFSKFKCQEIMKTEPVGMIAFDPAATVMLQNRDVPTLLSPENPEPIASAVLENKTTTGVTPVISEPLLLKPVIEDNSIQSSVKYEITQNKVPEPLSTIAFEFVSSPPEESNEALLLDADADDAAEIDKLLDVAMEINSEEVVGSLEKLLVVEKLFKPKRLEELCEEALILDVDESHMPKVLEELSMEAIILDVDSTNLAEEICLENPLLDTSSSLKLDNVGAINRLDNLIRDSVSKENLMLKEKSDSWGSGEFKTKRTSELDGMRTIDDIFKRMTPDDERSSDSDFREKTSLSENGEDAGEKYNLEDIEGELETCGQLGTPSSDSGLERTPHDDLKSFDGRGEEDEGDEFWKQQMASLQQAAGKTLALFHEAVGTDLSPCEEEKAYATSWFRRSEEESSPKSSSSTGSGTYGDNTYVSFGIDDESVAAIRNELQQKLPKLERQNSDGDIADADGEDEELKREDITIHYNIYPAPLSPILEEQESLFASENCSPSDSPGFFLHAQRATSSAVRQNSLSNSGSSSPELSPHQSSPQRQSPQTSPKINRSEQFEADIKAALEQCTSAEQRQAEEEEEEEDVLFVNTETNEAKLVESPLRPKLPYLAFVNGQQIYSGAGESDNDQWVEDEESTEKTQAYLEQFDAVTSFSEPDPEDGSGIVSWMAVPITRAPMPSPEEEQAPIVAEPPPCHTPDWESDTASEGSSSSGEFVWKEGDREAQVKAVSEEDGEDTGQLQNQQPCSPSKTYEALSEFPMASITEEDEEIDSASTSSSGTEFVPSSWNSEAAPSRSSLRSPDKKSDQKKNVSFKRQKYHCVYEYPREASDTEPEDSSESRRQWGLAQQVDYASFADWDLLDDEITEGGDQDTDPDSSEHTKPETFDFYKLSNIDCDFTNGLHDDGEFFITSSSRPFHLNPSPFSSQFFPGLATVEAADPTSPGGSSGGSSNSTTPPSPLSPASMGELRHTRDRLKLDLPKFSLAPVNPKSPAPIPTPAPSVEPAVDESQA